MSNMNFITFIMQLPNNSIQKINEDSFLLTLPVSLQQCPNCNNMTSNIHSYRNQPLKDIHFISSGHCLIYRKRRYICTHCSKTFAEANSFLSKYQRMSKSTIAAIIKDYGYLTSSTDIANRYKVSVTTVQRLFRSITASSPMLSAVISIDEFKGNAGAKFQVVINDLTTHTCLNIIEDRSPDILYAKILEYPLAERLKVRHVSIDLSPSFKKLVQECFPNAAIAADKFHTVRLANDALDTVRKEIQATLPDWQRKYFKHSRYLLLSRAENLKTDEDRLALQIMLNYSDKLSAAYALKECYFNIMNSKDSKEFVTRLTQFQLAVERQGLKSFHKLLNTTIKWKSEIIHAISTGYNNGFTEGCNTTIKNLKRICYSFRNFNNFKQRILFLLNNPDRQCNRKHQLITEI